MADEGKRLLGYAFNYIADVGNGQQFQVTGSLPLDATQEHIEKEFDKLRNVVEKHRTRSVIPNLKKGIAELELKLDNLTDTLKDIDEKNKDKKQLPSNEALARQQITTNLKHDRAELEHKKKVLAEAEAELVAKTE